MRAGTINRRVAIDEPVVTRDETGGEAIDWVEYATVWAQIEPLRGREALINGANVAQMDTRIRIRWSEHVDVVAPKWRLRWGQTIYDVVSLSHILTGRRQIELLCKSGTNEG